MTENEKPGMPERVKINRFGGVTDGDGAEYVRADLYEAMREVLVGIAADGCTIHDEDPPCEMGDPACVARKFLAALAAEEGA